MLPFVGAKQQQRVHRLRVEGIRQTGQIGFSAIDPDGVGIDVKERSVTKLRQRLSDSAAGSEQQSALVGNCNPRPGALDQDAR